MVGVLPSAALAQTPPYSVTQDGVPTVEGTSPVSLSGGDASVGGSGYAGGVLKGEAHAAVDPPNSLTNASTEFGGQESARYDDIVISGPPGAVSVDIKLRLRFSANYTQHFEQLSDGATTINSSAGQQIFFRGELRGPLNSGIGRAAGGLDVSLNRGNQSFGVVRTEAVNAQFIPTPRDPTAGPIDPPAGFIRQFTRQVTPITGGAYAGVAIDEIDELRGVILLSLTVPVGVPLTLDLNLQQRSKAFAFYLVGATGFLDARHTFGVPQDGSPVFELPDGYTADSPSLGIVDNVVPGDSSLRCPQPQGYWKNNPGVWPSSTLTLGAQTYTAAELLTILKTPVGGHNADASLILAYQLIAAKLNVANGSDPAAVAAAINTADTLLSGLTGRLPYRIKPSSAVGKQLTATASALESYNLLQLTPTCIP